MRAIAHGIEGEKHCPRCDTTKHCSEFGSNRGAASGMQSWCLICHRDRAQQWRERNPAASRAAQKKCRYGVDAAEEARMLEVQGQRCVICWDDFKSTRDRHVDHCHKTGVVRGIACNNCNAALGLMDERSDAIWRLYHYARYTEDITAGMASGPFLERVPA
jgi:hypothetical protein